MEIFAHGGEYVSEIFRQALQLSVNNLTFVLNDLFLDETFVFLDAFSKTFCSKTHENLISTRWDHRSYVLDYLLPAKQ